MTSQTPIDAFLFHCQVERRLSDHTVRAYRSDLKDFNAFAANNQSSNELTQAQIKAYLEDMTLSRQLSAATIRRRLACLKAFARFQEETAGRQNPFTTWSPSVKRPTRLPRALTAPEVRQIISPETTSAKPNPNLRFAILLLCATGLRVSELCSLRVIDVNEDGSALHVSGKGARDRIVYVGDEPLRKELTRRRQRRLDAEGSSASLLLNLRGNPLKPQTLRQQIHKARLQAGMSKRVTPHMLRHTAATILIETGTDIRFVQRLLGHASISTTEIYTQVNDAALKRAIFAANALGKMDLQ